MGYLSIIGEENLKNCFSAKQITVLNNKKTERKLYVVTNKGEFFGGFAPIFFNRFFKGFQRNNKKHLETSKTFIQKK